MRSIPDEVIRFSIDLIFPVAKWTLGSTHPLTEISTRDLSGDKVWLALRLTTAPSVSSLLK
jgi:hypothetical protein